MPKTSPLFAPNPHLLDAQRRVLEVTLKLIELDHQLYEIAEGLPLPPTYTAMEEELIPYTGTGHLYVTLLQVKGQHFHRAIQTLLTTIQQRDEEPLFTFCQDR